MFTLLVFGKDIMERSKTHQPVRIRYILKAPEFLTGISYGFSQLHRAVTSDTVFTKYHLQNNCRKHVGISDGDSTRHETIRTENVDVSRKQIFSVFVLSQIF